MPTEQTLSEKLVKLVAEKKSAREIQERRHSEWNENYELYRNKVKTNRLTQRQSVNVPLMKETIQTLLSTQDSLSIVKWHELSGDEMKSLVYQQKWDDFIRENDAEILDIVDKKNVFLYGISHKFLNLTDTGVELSIPDTYDLVFDPAMNPLDVETARFFVRQNIFKPLREILASDRYTAEGKTQLKTHILTPNGIVQSGKNLEEWRKKNERLLTMGLQDSEFKLFAGGDTVISLTEHFTQIWDEKAQEFERRVIVYANDTIELSDDSLEELIGMTEWPVDRWSTDPETNDIYPDGIGDMIRPLNKTINVWFSQQVENRTLQNFQMHWYDSTNEGYTAQTYEPGPGRMLPAPGNPKETIMPVQINGLDETMEAINFIIQMGQRATGATAIEKGVSEQGQQTLGEIQILVGKASERSKTMGKFDRASWYRIARKWDKMMQANDFGPTTLYKTGPDGKLYPKEVTDKDWKSEAGYRPEVASSSEQEADQIKSLQKFGYVIAQNPNNMILKKILQQRQLKLLDLSPAELKEIEDEEKRMAEQAVAEAQAAQEQGMMQQPQMPQPQAQPQAEAPDITSELEELNGLMAQ